MQLHGLPGDDQAQRLGFQPEDAVEFARFVQSLPRLEVRGLMTHFSNADDEEDSITREQIAIYKKTAEALKENGLLPPIGHGSNSDATMRFEAAR